MLNEPRDLHAPVLSAMRQTITSVKDIVLRGEQPVDVRLDRGNEHSLEDQIRILGRLFPIPGVHSHERAPISAERVTLNIMRRALREWFPNCHVVGDKAHPDELASAASSRVGDLVFSVDAIDGSLPYDVLTFGFGVSVVAYWRTDAGVKLLLSAVANSSDFAASFESTGDVWIGDLAANEREVNDWTSRDAVEDTVAILATEPQYRARFRRLLADRTLTVFTTGGVPASLGLLMGGLEALVSIEQQTVHDAAYLPICARVGYKILTASGPLGVLDVERLFESVGSDWSSKPIPPFIVSRREDAANYLGRYVFRE